MKMKRLLLLLALPALLPAKTLVVISPHGGDFVIYAGGTIARMIDDELIRSSRIDQM